MGARSATEKCTTGLTVPGEGGTAAAAAAAVVVVVVVAVAAAVAVGRCGAPAGGERPGVAAVSARLVGLGVSYC